MSDVGAKRGRDVAEAGDSVPPGRAAASFADAADECVHGEAEDVPTAAAPPAVVTAQKPVAASTACEPTSKRGRAHSDNEGATGIRALTSALVQVGDGTYMGFEHEGLKELHCATLLQALLASSVFGGELPAMSLGRCSVYVGHTASKKKPTADEEAAAAADPLEGLETLGDRAAGLPPKANLFIRVQLPAAAAPAAVQVRSLAAMSALPDSHDISRVVAAIRSGSVTQNTDGHLLLPAGVTWPVASNNVLFVRWFAAPLFESVLNRCMPVIGDPERCQRRIITGQPGIGKSVWGWYVIYRVLNEQPMRTVIYAEGGNIFVIPPAGPIRRSPALSELALADLEFMPDLGKNPLLVADSLLPPALPFPTLVISSPGRLGAPERKNTLNKYYPRHYLPLPTDTEVLALYRLAFSELAEADVRLRLQLWGPIVRHVLVHVRHLEQLNLWDAIKSVKLDVLVAFARTLAAGEGTADERDPRHRILHEHAAGERAAPGTPGADPAREEFYARGAVTIASPSILRWVAERLLEEKKWDLAYLIDASAGIGALGALRGIKFEEAALAVLEQGCTLEYRALAAPPSEAGAGAAAALPAADDSDDDEAAALGGAGAGALAAPPAAGDGTADTKRSARAVLAAPRVEWSHVAELAPFKNVQKLLVPRDRNAAGLDALVWDADSGHHVPLDCTISKQHGLHAKGLADAVTQLGWSPGEGWPRPPDAKKKRMQIKYFWAVPQDVFDKWLSRQRAKDGSDTTLEAKAAYKNAKQYVLCVPPQLTITQVAAACERQRIRLPAELLGL